MSAEGIGEKLNTFGFDVYRKLSQTPGNVFFSPISISFALAMTSLGAKGSTLKEIIGAMKLDKVDKKDIHAWFKDIKKGLFSEQGEFILAIASKLYGDKSNNFIDVFKEKSSKNYGAKLEELDFKENAEEARTVINNWVSSNTKENIKELLVPGAINASTQLVLVNGIYFKGQWQKNFLYSNTKDEDFHVSPGEVVKVPTMNAVLDVNHGFHKKLKSDVLELRYRGDRLSMFILLPKIKTPLQDVEKALNGSIVSTFTLTQKWFEVFLPKFKMEPSLNMKEKLSDLGVKALFNKADLSGLEATKTLSVSLMVHKAFIEVNEKGAGAAPGATEMEYELKSKVGREMAIQDFRVNHPFIFLIYDKKTKTILMIGKYVNPEVQAEKTLEVVEEKPVETTDN